MKKVVCLPLISLALAVVSFIQPPGTLVGQWQQKFAGNVTVKTIFRADDTFDIFVNGKTFVSGKYKVSQDTLSIADPACGLGYYGAYKLDFFAQDSLRLIVLNDACNGRRQGFDKVTLGRLKTTKP